MTYTIALTRDEIVAIRSAVFAQRENLISGSAELARLENIYGKLLEATTASDNVARRMQEEGDKYGHD